MGYIRTYIMKELPLWIPNVWWFDKYLKNLHWGYQWFGGFRNIYYFNSFFYSCVHAYFKNNKFV